MKAALAALPLLAPALAACQSVDDSDWVRGEYGSGFNQAERGCEELTERTIEQESKREEFFVGCMKALGWTPKPGIDPVG
ncbi:MAG: hypothetical protein ACR2FJ_10230 [Qipengyuania sp.]